VVIPYKEGESKTISVVALSDTHNSVRTIGIPNSDILIHAGDFTNHGSKEEITQFNEWLGTYFIQ
jgi:3',5'-cyclic AMP phosphodiesterase CpdA